jgi:hypothetical protein
MPFPWEKGATSLTTSLKQDFAKGMDDGLNNTEFLFAGLICAYASISTKDILLGLQSSGELVCVELNVCIAANAKPWEVKFDMNKTRTGAVQERYVYAALPCCELKIKKPETILASKSKLFCLNAVGALPFKSGYIDQPVCGLCFLRVLPQPIGCMLGTGQKAPFNMVMH